MKRIKTLIHKVLIVALSLISATVIGAQRSDFELVRDTEILINMMRSLQQYYVDSLSSDELLRLASYGISNSLDPYTTYINEEEMKDFEVMTTGKYGGIGAIIAQGKEYVTIAEPYKGSPADKSGLKIGDRIVEIEGEDAKGMTTEQMSSRLKGTPGSRVKIVVSSVIDSSLRKVTIKRERISIPAISYYGMLNDSVAYLNHADFTDGCYDQIRAALDDLKSQGMKSLVLDYRSNGGGIMQEAIKVLSLFVPKGSEVLTIKERSDSTVYRTSNEPPYADLPMVVLINGSSASATEIVAGALQDMDRAVLVGQRSFGKGLVQSTVPVGYNAYVKITTARYYIPSGRCIQAIDYSSHSSDEPRAKMADSLQQEFRTRAGRVVKDGGGIMPDVEMEGRYVSRFAMRLYSMGLITKWGEEYYRRHYKEEIDFDNFAITQADYNDFVTLALANDVRYESQSSLRLKALEEAAEEDRNEELIAELARVRELMHDDTQSHLERYRAEIEELLNQDVVLRRGYSDGVIRHTLPTDPEVQCAVEILGDVARQKEILEGEVSADK
ncbi:MAG: S41 family peptidase [Rikenellaceae bacterium]